MCVQPDPALSPFTEPPKRSLVFTRVFVRHIAHILYNGRELIADDEVVRLWVQSESPPETLDAAHQVVDFVKRSVRLQVGDKMQIRRCVQGVPRPIREGSAAHQVQYAETAEGRCERARDCAFPAPRPGFYEQAAFGARPNGTVAQVGGVYVGHVKLVDVKPECLV